MRCVQQIEHLECFLSSRKGACKRSWFKLIGVSPEIRRWLPKQEWISWGTMHAIFSDSIFGTTTYVSLCWYMKWNNLNRRWKGVFPFAFQPLARFSSSSVNAYHWVWKSKPLKLKLGALDLFVTGSSHFVRSKRSLSFSNVKRSCWTRLLVLVHNYSLPVW